MRSRRCVICAGSPLSSTFESLSDSDGRTGADDEEMTVSSGPGGRRVDEALAMVENLVDHAAAAGVPSVEVLHGKGTGALRAAIREALAARSDVAGVEAAEWNQGGEGVTVVKLGPG